MDQEGLASQLKALGAELQAVGEDREQQATLLKRVEELLGSIRVKDMPELAESPIIQQFVNLIRPADMRPGEVRNRGTLAEVDREWSWRDMSQFPTKTFITNETLPITWNGLTAWVYADQEVTLPEPFYNIWREHVKARQQAELHVRYALGQSDVPPDPSWITDETAKVRAQSVGGKKAGGYEGHYLPGAGGWPDRETEGEKPA